MTRTQARGSGSLLRWQDWYHLSKRDVDVFAGDVDVVTVAWSRVSPAHSDRGSAEHGDGAGHQVGSSAGAGSLGFQAS